jgi:hypothetical protein
MRQLYLSLQLITEHGYIWRATILHTQGLPFISKSGHELNWQKSIKFGKYFSYSGVETCVKF